MSDSASKDWVRAYLDEAASVDIKTAKDTYDRFLRERELILREMNEERKVHHQTAQNMAHVNEELRQKNKKLAEFCEELSDKMEDIEQRVHKNTGKLHRAEMVRCEREQHKRAARSADES